MIPSQRIVLVYLAAIIAVGYATWLYRSSGDALTARGPVPLFPENSLPIEEVHKITLLRTGEPPIIFELHGPDWLQTAPFEWPMQFNSIRQLILDASRLQVSRQINPAELDPQTSLSTLGLTAPEATIRYEWAAGSAELQLGRPSVAGRAYIRLTGKEEIFVVGQELHDRAVAMDPREWRSRTLFQNVGLESDRVELHSGGTTLALIRDRRRWSLEKPAATRAEPAVVEALLRDIASAQSSGFVADQPSDLTRYGLTEPVGTIVVVGKDAGGALLRQELLVGSPTGVSSTDRFAMVSGRPAVVKLPGTALKEIFITPETVIDPIATSVTAADVKSISIDGPAGAFTITRDVDRWIAPDHDNASIRTEFVEDLLAQLTSVRAPTINIQPFPLNLSIATITLKGFTGKPLDTIRVAREENGKKIALENGDNVLRVFTDIVSLRLTPEAFGLTDPPRFAPHATAPRSTSQPANE